jgi:hypothetical protein
MLRPFQLSESQLQRLADVALPAGRSLDEQLRESSDEVTARLVQSSLLRSFWYERAEIAYRNTTNYLRQEGLLAGASVGIVDVGWLGKASGALAGIVEAEGTTVRCYFTGGLVGAESISAPSGSRAFLVDTRGTVPPDLSSLVHLLETFCSGTEGSTLGYEEIGGTYEPKLNSPKNDIALRWGLAKYQDIICRFVETACENLAVAGEELDLASLGAVRFPVRQNIALLWNDPSGREASAWGSFPFETNDGRAVALASLPHWGSIGKYLKDPVNQREAVRLGPWLAADLMLIVSPLGAEHFYRTSRMMYQRVRDGLPSLGMTLLGRVNHRWPSGGRRQRSASDGAS